jgi:hypothetical protein
MTLWKAAIDHGQARERHNLLDGCEAVVAFGRDLDHLRAEMVRLHGLPDDASERYDPLDYITVIGIERAACLAIIDGCCERPGLAFTVEPGKPGLWVDDSIHGLTVIRYKRPE